MVEVVQWETRSITWLQRADVLVRVVETLWKDAEERGHRKFGFRPSIMCRRIDESRRTLFVRDRVPAPKITVDQRGGLLRNQLPQLCGDPIDPLDVFCSQITSTMRKTRLKQEALLPKEFVSVHELVCTVLPM